MKKESIKEILEEAKKEEDRKCSHSLGRKDLDEAQPRTYDLTLKVKDGYDDELFTITKRGLDIFALKFLAENIEQVNDLVDFKGLLEREMEMERELEFQKEQTKASKK